MLFSGRISYLGYCVASVLSEWVVEEWSDKGDPKFLETTLSHRHFINQKSVMDWPGTEPMSSRWETLNEPSEPWHDPGKFTLVFAE